jgi:tape measure domain-containing protein
MTNGFTYLIGVDVKGSGAVSRLVGSLESTENHLSQISAKTSQASSKLQEMGNRGSASLDGMRSRLGGLIAQLGVAAFAVGSLGVAANKQGLETAITFTSGGAKEGAENLKHLKEQSDKYGLSLQASQEGFKTLDGAMMNSGLSQGAVRSMFDGVAMGSAALNLSAEDSKGVLLAMGQMMSKGKVSAEELNGQIGERLPGALGIASKAMGMSSAALMQMMQDGKLVAKDFLPKFAAELQNTFGGQAANQANSATANFARMKNSLYELQAIIGEKLLPTVMKFLKEFLMPGAKWIGDNIDMITNFAIVLGTLRVAAMGYTTYLGIMSIVTSGFTGTFWGLNAALLANPITWVVAGIIALVAAVVIAYNKFDQFRGFIWGLGGVLKVFGKLLFDVLITPILLLGKTLMGIFTGDLSMIKDGIVGFGKNLLSVGNQYRNIGENIGNAFQSGFNDGVANFANPATSAGGSLMGKTDAVTSALSGKTTATAKDPKTTAGINSITGGGAKQTTFNIQIGKLQDKIEIHVATAVEGVDRMGEEVLKKLAQAINNMQQSQVN